MLELASSNGKERGYPGFLPRCLMLVLLLVILCSSSSSARIFVYDGNQSAGSIQEVVNGAGSGDSLFIKGGKYYENLVVNKSLKIGALDNTNPPVIISQGGEAGITLLADGTEIDGISVSGNALYGVLIRSNNNRLSNLTLQDLKTGIGIKSAERNRLINNIIVNNTVGLELEGSSKTNALSLNYFENTEDVSGQPDELTWDHIPTRYIYSGETFSGPLGNYWVKYMGEDTQGDGIGDTPYVVEKPGAGPGNTSSVILDSAPLIEPPEDYTLERREQLPFAIPSGYPLQGENMPGSGPGALSGSGPGSMIGPQGPAPVFPSQFLWIIPVAIVLSIIAGILFERSRRTGKAGTGMISPDRQTTGKETIVHLTDPGSRTGNPPADDHYYSVRLPPPLDQKYPGAEYRGEGGIGRVFKATDGEGNPVAIKIPIRYDEITGTHFTKELHLWQGLHHKNIVEIHSANIFPVPYIEIEYAGDSLASLSLPLDAKRAIAIVLAVAEGLQYAHGKGIIHRDIKPENILIAADGTPKITDWGLAKAIADTRQTGLISFSLDYASPEQLAPNIYGETGPWTDIYQLGVVFYTMITGHVPFMGDGMGEVTQAILHTEPPPIPDDIPGRRAIQDIITRCLAKNPQDRYESVTDLIRDLQDIDRKP